ncbi:kinesin-like protein KIF25 isoform X2 [Terrapene carolina triunguis]|uniref:kinesin-like protein KIF25 isoform X2 n=1 Tax=Terrapene triunguis TaxID=2587831 RepID=UPI000CEFB3EB|nr:kinesin-like protein KIF25 isoform X2 [Terrapene carolina triunguis]
MRPDGGISPSFVAQQRIRQLEQKLRAKEERIVVLETENALLHLKLAECRGLIGRDTNEVAQLNFVHDKQQNLCRSTSSVIIQVYGAIQRLKRDLKNLHSFALELSRDFQHQCKNSLYQVLTAVQRIQLQNEAMQTFQTKAFDLEQSLQEVNERYQQEKQKRKILHNSLVELRGNIRVHCRIRPLLPFDTASGHSVSQDRVYSAAESQDTVFADVAPLLTSLLDGYNVCIMAYGQTGSGKTYTMLGPQSEDDVTLSIEDELELGIIPRATEEVFRLISEKPSGSHWVEVSVVEVYNNEIFDLLAKDSCGRVFGVKRDVVTTKEGKSDVPLLTYETVENAVEFLQLVDKGLQLRVKHPTLVHAHSSRSHLVVTLTITMKAVSADSFAPLWTDEESSPRLSKELFCTFPQQVKDDKLIFPSRASSPAQFESTEKLKHIKTKLQLVDLAGSECVGMSGVTGVALRETSFINRSLSALSDVLGAIAEQRSHIPYRNSKLTHLLQDSIGGNAKLLVMLCVSPCQKYVAESLQSLGFGTRARQVQRGQVKKRNLPVSSKSK